MLKGEKVILRPLKMEDLPKVNEWRNDLELIKLTQGIRFPKTKEMDVEWFGNALTDMSNKNIYFGIDELNSGVLVGLASIHNIDYVSGTALWGLMIGDEKNKGKGFGRESLGLLFGYAFNVLNLRKISGHHIEYNQSVIALHQHFHGVFEEARLIRHVYYDNRFHDVLILSLFRGDYFKENS